LVANFILKLIPLEIWMAKVLNKLRRNNKITDPEMVVVESRQQPHMIAESEQNPLHAQLDKKNSSKQATHLNEILRKPSKTNSIIRSASKNFYRGKNEDVVN
jgi:hypothetical protein